MISLQLKRPVFALSTSLIRDYIKTKLTRSNLAHLWIWLAVRYL